MMPCMSQLLQQGASQRHFTRSATLYHTFNVQLEISPIDKISQFKWDLCVLEMCVTGSQEEPETQCPFFTPSSPTDYYS